MVCDLEVPCAKNIAYSLHHHLYDQAVFFADRMPSVGGDMEIWADALLRAGEYEQVRWRLKGRKLSARLRYLMAVACLKLGKYSEAKMALLEDVELWSTGRTDDLDNVVEGAAGLFQLGQAEEALGRKEQAYVCYKKCLELNPFMWCAFERFSWLSLCLRKSTRTPKDFAEAIFTTKSQAKAEEPSAFRTPKRRRSVSPSSPWLPLCEDTPLRANVEPPKAPDTESESLSRVLQTMAEALHGLHRFRCQDAMDAIRTLHEKEQHSAFCEDLVARCHFEMQNYEKAAECYARCCSRHHFRGLEYYSTALWQLGDRLELCNLSRQVLEWGRHRPQAWCVLGNCFSLSNEAEEAIKCFKRAIQLDPKLVYAYSLIGHEFVALEKYDKAVEMFQAAIDMDTRQYNAWWGLGDVNQRREDLGQAKYNFSRALDINPFNEVLKTSLGAVLQQLGEKEQALQLLSTNTTPMSLFQKGRAKT